MTDKEYIERNSLLDEVKQIEGAFARPLIIRKIEEAPIADVVEVKHGYWKWKELYGEVGYMLVCSECEESEGACERYDYCPNCGTKMDGGDIK